MFAEMHVFKDADDAKATILKLRAAKFNVRVMPGVDQIDLYKEGQGQPPPWIPDTGTWYLVVATKGEVISPSLDD